MLKFINTWFENTFADRQAAILTLILLFCFLVILFFGKLLTPFLAAIVMAYLLDSAVRAISKGLKLHRSVSVTLVYLLFLLFLTIMLIIILPLAYEELMQFVNDAPGYIQIGKDYLLLFTEKYPTIFSSGFNDSIRQNFNDTFASFSKSTFNIAVQFVPGLVNTMIYLVMVPMLVLFMLKDKYQIIGWFSSFLPPDHALATRVWQEVNDNIGNYIKGKFVELFIVTIATYIGFLFFGLQYALILAFAVGISVFVPYIGAIAVTIPVALVGLSQFGLTPTFAYAMLTYLVIQVLDGYVLVPILFSERVNLHPVAILAAIMVFGEVWGFWGLLFAIPLAILIQAVLNAWPRPARQPQSA
jgi:putative permease